MGKHDKKKKIMTLSQLKQFPGKVKLPKITFNFVNGKKPGFKLNYYEYDFSTFSIASEACAAIIAIVLYYIQIKHVYVIILTVIAESLALFPFAINTLVFLTKRGKRHADIFIFVSCILFIISGYSFASVFAAVVFRIGKAAVYKTRSGKFAETDLRFESAVEEFYDEANRNNSVTQLNKLRTSIKSDFGKNTLFYRKARSLCRNRYYISAFFTLINLIVFLCTHNLPVFLGVIAAVFVILSVDELPDIYADMIKLFCLSGLNNRIYILNETAPEKTGMTETAVFSKTAVITSGEFKVTDIKSIDVSEEYLLSVAACAEQFSDHPIAKAICDNIEPAYSDIEDVHFDEIEGMGMVGHAAEKSYIVGNAILMNHYKIMFRTPLNPGTAVHVAEDGKYLGYIMVKDSIQDGAFETIEYLRNQNISNFVLLSGDVKTTARQAASKLNFDMVKYELLPDEKIKALNYLQINRNPGTAVSFVGSAESDSKVISFADNGISISKLNVIAENSDLAACCCDINILMPIFNKCKKFTSFIKYTMLGYYIYNILALVLLSFAPNYSAYYLLVNYIALMMPYFIRLKWLEDI